MARVVGGLACLLVAITPVTVALSQVRLNDAVAALKARDCSRAVDSALGSIGALNRRAEPFEVLGWCDLRGGQLKLGLDAMRAAERRDPGNWEYAYGVAVAQAPRRAGSARRGAAGAGAQPAGAAGPAAGARGARRPPGAWRRAAARAPIPDE